MGRVSIVFCLFGIGFCFLPFNHQDVVPQDRGNDRDHICLDDSSSHILAPSDTNVDDTLKCQIPLPHVHVIFTPSLLQQAHQPFHTAIDSQDIPDSGRGGGQIGEMVEGVDQGEGGSTIEGSSVIEGGGDVDGRLVDVRDAEIDLSHAETRHNIDGGDTMKSKSEQCRCHSAITGRILRQYLCTRIFMYLQSPGI
jgi:hypothetical protein